MTCVSDECRQGRDRCPTPEQCCERTRRIQESDLRWTQDAIGVECALPIVTTELREVPSFWQRVGFAAVVALCLLWAAIAIRG